MIFFTSDSHFSCEIVFDRDKRPFKNVHKSDKYIIKTWNKQAKKGDTIYCIGDFCSYSSNCSNIYEKGLKFVKKLKADVVLILGNNEERLIKGEFDNSFEDFKNYCLNLGFKDVKIEEFLEINDNKFYLNHYPTNHKDGYINLFGHVHRARGLYRTFGLNVACASNYLRLHSVNDIMSYLKQKELFWDTDENVIC